MDGVWWGANCFLGSSILKPLTIYLRIEVVKHKHTVKLTKLWKHQLWSFKLRIYCTSEQLNVRFGPNDKTFFCRTQNFFFFTIYWAFQKGYPLKTNPKYESKMKLFYVFCSVWCSSETRTLIDLSCSVQAERYRPFGWLLYFTHLKVEFLGAIRKWCLTNVWGSVCGNLVFKFLRTMFRKFLVLFFIAFFYNFWHSLDFLNPRAWDSTILDTIGKMDGTF